VNRPIRFALPLLLLAASTAGFAAETTPAWQEPGYVMEEIVVTARAPESGTWTHTAHALHARLQHLLAAHPRLLERLLTATTDGSRF
jgi:hypothetical protein